jgi:hypothetical protein
MGYFVVYCPQDAAADITGGDHVASNAGYDDFLRWAETLDGLPALAALAEEGAADADALEADLARALQPGDQEGGLPGAPSPQVKGVAERLLAAVRERPEGTAAVGVTDGTAGEEEEEGSGEQLDLARAVEALARRDQQQDRALGETATKLAGALKRFGIDLN